MKLLVLVYLNIFFKFNICLCLQELKLIFEYNLVVELSIFSPYFIYLYLYLFLFLNGDVKAFFWLFFIIKAAISGGL